MRIFLFHRVNEIKDEFWPPMRPKTFEYLIKKFTKKCHVVNLEDYLRGEFDKQINHEKIVSIVFDDGYKDFINYALPILKKFQIKPSMYVVTNAIENNEPIWTYKVDKIIANTSKSLDLSKYNFLGEIFSKSQTKYYKIKLASDFKKYLKSINDDERKKIIDDFCITHEDVFFNKNIYMNWNDLKQIKSHVSIGSHTHTHPMLGNIENLDYIKEELMISKNLIEKNLNTDCEVISYPNGSFNGKVQKCALELGYKYGLAVNNRIYNKTKFDNFEIPRIELYEENRIKSFFRRSLIIENIKKFV